MIPLFVVGCTLFEPRNPDAPPPQEPPPPVVVPPVPVPVDTGAPVDRSTLAGEWEGPCAFDSSGYTSFYGGSGYPTPTDSGAPLPDDSGGYGGNAQSASVMLTLVETGAGEIFGGASIRVDYGFGDGFSFGAGVTGTRSDDDEVELDLRIGELPAGRFLGEWTRSSDELTGDLTFEGYAQSSDCVLTR